MVLLTALIAMTGATVAEGIPRASVRPAVGGPKTKFRVKLKAPQTLGRGSEFRYVARISIRRGRAGANRCDTSGSARIPRRVKKGKRLRFTIKPKTPKRKPRWCKGSYIGKVALEKYVDPCALDDGICRDSPFIDRRVKARFKVRVK